MTYHANMRVIINSLWRRQQNQLCQRGKGFGKPDQLFANALPLVSLVDGEIGHISAV